MADSNPNDAGKGSRELWLLAAYQALVRSGVDAVRIQTLGKALKLSRTSFYWFFEDREDLLEALLGLWREKNTGGLVRRAGAYSESIAEAILNVFDCWLEQGLFDAAFEFAVRSWALQSDEVTAEIARADEARIGALTRMFTRHGFDTAAADVRARTIYLTQIGYISMKTEEDLATRLRRIPHYVEIFTGARPDARELDRFHARHPLPEAGLPHPGRPQGQRQTVLK